MLELTLSFEGKPIKTYQLNKDQILVGRDPTCDVQIDNVGVSRHHARIEKKGATYVVNDLKSGNGTFVNGKRISAEYNLNSGDEIGLWNYSIIFKTSGGAATQQGAPAQAAASAPASAPAPQAEKPAPASPKKMDLDMTIAIDSRQLDLKQRERGSSVRGYLTYQDPKHGQRSFSLLKTTTFFGKGQACDFHLAGWNIMPKHAMIVRDESGFRFVNFAKSHTGTLNGQAIDDKRLKEGDIIKIGNIAYKFQKGLPGKK